MRAGVPGALCARVARSDGDRPHLRILGAGFGHLRAACRTRGWSLPGTALSSNVAPFQHARDASRQVRAAGDRSVSLWWWDPILAVRSGVHRSATRWRPCCYATSTLHCLTVSLALDGAGLGTVFGEQKAILDLGRGRIRHRRDPPGARWPPPRRVRRPQGELRWTSSTELQPRTVRA